VKRFFWNSALVGMAEILCRLPLVFTVGYLARSVGADNFGNWSLILALQVCIVGITGLGLSASVSRFLPASAPDEAAAYLRYAFVLCFICIVVAGVWTLLLKVPLAGLLGIKMELAWLLPAAAVLAAGSVADGLLDAFFKARMAVGRQICFVAARTVVEVVGVTLAFVFTPTFLDEASLRLAAYAGVVVVGKLIIYPGLLVGMAKGHALPPVGRRREFLRYGLPMVPTLLAVWLATQSDRLVLSHFVAKSDLGVYAFGASLATYTAFIGYAVYPLLLPATARLHDEGNVAGIASLFRTSQQLFILLWAAVMTCLALWSGDIIAWTGGSAFAGAAPVLLILSFAVGIEQLMGVYQYVFHLVKRTDLILWLNVANAAIMAGSLAIAGMTSGIALAPWAVLSGTIVFNVLRYWFGLRYAFLPIPAVLVGQALGVGVMVTLLARYASEWSAPLRLAVTAIALLVLAGVIRRRLMASSFREFS
jgi:O-antigen/teichoic acid export membrane protein